MDAAPLSSTFGGTFSYIMDNSKEKDETRLTFDTTLTLAIVYCWNAAMLFSLDVIAGCSLHTGHISSDMLLKRMQKYAHPITFLEPNNALPDFLDCPSRVETKN